MKAFGVMFLTAVCATANAVDGAPAKNTPPFDSFNCDGADRVHIQGNDLTKPSTVEDTHDTSNPAKIDQICRFPSTIHGAWSKPAFDAPLLRRHLEFFRNGKLVATYGVGKNFVAVGESFDKLESRADARLHISH